MATLKLKLIPGIPENKLNAIKEMSRASNESASAWIRRQMFRPLDPAVVIMSEALGITSDEFITRAIRQALAGGLRITKEE